MPVGCRLEEAIHIEFHSSLLDVLLQFLHQIAHLLRLFSLDIPFRYLRLDVVSSGGRARWSSVRLRLDSSYVYIHQHRLPSSMTAQHE
jgi:hypothetical protein